VTSEAAAFEHVARAHADSRGAAGTRSLYAADLDRWLEFCRELQVDPSRPTLEAATAWRDHLRSKHAAQTVRRALSALSSMYEAALGFEQPLATWNPFKRLPRPPAALYAKTEAVSDVDAQSILGAAEADPAPAGRRDASILRLLYDTGLRRASVAALRRNAVIFRDTPEGEETVLRVIVKGDKENEVVLPEKAARALRAWAQHNPAGLFMFPGRDSRRPITPNAINRIVELRARQAGVKGVHPHQFRAAFATTALDSGQPLHDVQAAMHHADPSTTLRYDRGVRGTKVTAAVAEYREKKHGP